jgi:hypothetical protein
MRYRVVALSILRRRCVGMQALAKENLLGWRTAGRVEAAVSAKRPIKPIYTKRFLAPIEAAKGIGTK